MTKKTAPKTLYVYLDGEDPSAYRTLQELVRLLDASDGETAYVYELKFQGTIKTGLALVPAKKEKKAKK